MCNRFKSKRQGDQIRYLMTTDLTVLHKAEIYEQHEDLLPSPEGLAILAACGRPALATGF